MINKKIKKAISRLTAIALQAGHELETWKKEWPREHTWQTGCKHCGSYIYLFTDKNGNPKRHYEGLYECQSNYIFKQIGPCLESKKEMNKCTGTQIDKEHEQKKQIRFKHFIPIAQKFLSSQNPTATKLAKLLVEGERLLNYDEIKADEIEAGLLEKTTQESPEWFGRANCINTPLAAANYFGMPLEYLNNPKGDYKWL